MKTEVFDIAGDTPGAMFHLTAHRFEGNDKTAPDVYLQAALHADELPGTAVLHYLSQLLLSAEKEGRIRGNITVGPREKKRGGEKKLRTRAEGRGE